MQHGGHIQSTDLWGNPTESSSGFACGTEASGSDTVSEPKEVGITMSAFGSVEALDNWAVDRESRTPKWYSTGAGDQAVLHEGENLELFAHLTAEAVVDCIFGPFKQLSVPSRAVIQRDRRDSTQDVVGAVAISQIRRQALPLRIVAPSRLGAVRGNENSFDGAGEAVIAAQMKLRHQRSEGVVLDGG